MEGGNAPHPSNHPVVKKKRNLPGTPDPEAEVISLSPKTLTATNRFVCEICGKGFQRDQNLQLHRRGHNLPWKLRQRSSKEPRKPRVYVCPEKSCVHHNPSRALGDLTGIKKHFFRKHGEKKWKCDKCSKKYAVRNDWKAHSKTCGTREYRCDCGTVFSRRDSFITHRAFCDALAEETWKLSATSNVDYSTTNIGNITDYNFAGKDWFRPSNMTPDFLSMFKPNMAAHAQAIAPGLNNNNNMYTNAAQLEQLANTSSMSIPSLYSTQHQREVLPSPDISATALLQKAARIGVTSSTTISSFLGDSVMKSGSDQCDIDVVHSTRDFLGVGVQTLCSSSISGWM
ncbi:zinc finger protein NUTCRACKER-like [Iris pallida]|uniref:Protein EARLY HEADING DATE 2 n=1 Tax=Iris pallida TaxID=29817 RepID=A0AAX6FAL6_IRIPA|nr:zinc finger protein NUTCRACKER-like [Iris pallida]